MAQDEIHVGSLIKKKLEEDGRSVMWLAKKIGCKRANVYNIFNRVSIETTLLLKVCLAIKYDFFLDLSDGYKKNLDSPPQ